MKKLLVFVIIMTSLIFGVQGFSQMNSKEFEKVIEKVSEEYDKGNRKKAISMLKEDIQKNPKLYWECCMMTWAKRMKVKKN